jgi:hypothetical protein
MGGTALMKWFLKSVGVNLGSLPFSGRSLAGIAVEPAFAEASGRYFQAHNGSIVEARSFTVSYDEQRAAKLWRDLEVLVGLQSDEGPRTLYENR